MATESARPFTYLDYQVDREAKIATVTLTNPSKGNAAPEWAEAELEERVAEWEADDDVKVVIIKGAGGPRTDFCAGHDVGTYLENFHIRGSRDAPKRRPSNREQLLVQRQNRMAWRALFFSLKPTIAQVDGQCIEFGNALQACCDMTIAADDAHLGNLGQVAGISGITIIRLYAQLMGFKRMREMMITGRTFSGRDAALAGLVNRSVPGEDLETEVLNEARRIALLPIDGIVTGKAYTHMVYESMGLGAAFSETYYGHMPGLKLQFQPDDFWFFNEIRNHGVSHAVRQRQQRYAPLGGFGAADERPIVRPTT